MALITPQYGNRCPASKKSSRTGAGNKRIGTRPERLLIRSLKELKIYIYFPQKRIQGNPDIVFLKKKVVVFCDGDFWHGKNWKERQRKLKTGTNADYWVKKIEYNCLRDKKNNLLLKKQGWTVIRVWESSIIKQPLLIAQKILEIINKKDNNNKIYKY